MPSEPTIEIKDLSLIENEFEISYTDVLPLQKGNTGKGLPIGVLANFFKNNSAASSQIAETAKSIVSGSNNSLFVDISNPDASDSKDNRGNSLEKPFRTIERALLEVSRRSFSDGIDNDKTARFSVFVFPGEYEVNNGYGSGPDIAYNRYQDAANLIFLNKEWIVDEAYNSVAVQFQTQELKPELAKFATALVNDIANFSNADIVTSAKSIVSVDGNFLGYYQNSSNVTAIESALTILLSSAILAVKGQAPVTIPGIVVDADSPSNPCQNVQSTVTSLINIVQQTLTRVTDPWTINIAKGSLKANFPESGEPTEFNLQSFNSSYRPGIIVPRGVSLVFMSLRTTVIRPKYVPAKDGSSGRGAIFRLTGDSFITGGTIKDAKSLAESHHNLHVYEYATLQDLEDYYDRVSFVFRDDILWSNLQDSANLAQANINWAVTQASLSSPVVGGTPENKSLFAQSAPELIGALVKDLRVGGSSNTKKFSEQFLATYISGLSSEDQSLLIGFFESAFTTLSTFTLVATANLATTFDGGVRDQRITPREEAQGRVELLFSIATSIIAGDTPPSLVPQVISVGDSEVVKGENEIVGAVVGGLVQDTTRHSSAYIFSTTLRSDYGMCGAFIDGTDVTGYKSFLAAQYTIVSYQNDADAFIPSVGQGDPSGKRYRGSSPPDTQDFRQYGFIFDNESYAQLVSCFVIGSAVHYWAKNGSVASVNNSVSNFGDISMLAEGYRKQAFPQDKGYLWSKIIKPKSIQRTGNAVLQISIGTIISAGDFNLELSSPVDFAANTPFTLRPGTKIYLDSFGEEAYAVVGEPGVNAESVNKVIIPISSKSPNFPTELSQQALYIKRVADRRDPGERIYRIIVDAPANGSRITPLENFILQLDKATHGFEFPNQQNKVFFLADVEKISERTFSIAVLESYKNPQGEADTYREATLGIDTDYEPDSELINDSGVGKASYNAIGNLLRALNYSEQFITDNLVAGTEDLEWDTSYVLNFHQPSILRGSHTWEYMGYLNPSTAFPQAQISILGEGLSPDEILKKRISKLFSQLKGGKVYTTGMDESGNFYLGQTLFDVKTGNQKDLTLPDSSQEGVYATTEKPGIILLAKAEQITQGINNRTAVTPLLLNDYVRTSLSAFVRNVTEIRLSLFPNTSVPEISGSSTSIYLHPYGGGEAISVINPITGYWDILSLDGDILEFDLLSIGANQPNTNYDVYLYNGGSESDPSIRLACLPWVNDITPPPRQRVLGAEVRNGLPNQRLIGVVRTTLAGTSEIKLGGTIPSAGASPSRCFLANLFNPYDVSLRFFFGNSWNSKWWDATDGRVDGRWGLPPGYGTNAQCQLVLASPQLVTAFLDIYSNDFVGNPTPGATGIVYVAPGINSSLTPPEDAFYGETSAVDSTVNSNWARTLNAGYNYIQYLYLQSGANLVNEHPAHGMITVFKA